MFSSAAVDQSLLDCLDQLEAIGTIGLDLPVLAANDKYSAQELYSLIHQAAEERLQLMIDVARSDVLNPDPRIWDIRETTHADGSRSVCQRIRYDKGQILGKLLRLMTPDRVPGIYCTGNDFVNGDAWGA